ncbi:nuclease-related domain-containing protein [Acidisoma silvae]|uniref:NERD domain-containing protein n=1 Tax=Acidisoma silvae TaxID=2802396 RepID=A0A963YWT4_9PROT|nr:nuclease-related domain-containing protein [Acidisoma silvae]MCB8878569.1 NERD domain-containing protein [Acidisoma silvae]
MDYILNSNAKTSVDHQPQPDRAAALGALGEALVAGVLRDMGWPVLRNVVLRGRGRSTEIDVIARAPAALVVFGVKTWSGSMHGTAEAAAWTRHSRGEVVEMPNAVTRNRTHVHAVERTIGDMLLVWGLVVSAGHARLAPALHMHVVPTANLVRVLSSIAEAAHSDPPAMERAWAILSREAARSPGRQTAHINWVKALWHRDGRSRHSGA